MGAIKENFTKHSCIGVFQLKGLFKFSINFEISMHNY